MMKTLLSLLATLAVCSAQPHIPYPFAATAAATVATAPLQAYASNFGYSSYGVEAGPPNSPFEFRSALDVFRPSAIPAAAAAYHYQFPAPAANFGYSPYYPSNSFYAHPQPAYFGGYPYAPHFSPVHHFAAAAAPAAAIAADIPAATVDELVPEPILKEETFVDEVSVIEADSTPESVPADADLSLRAIFPVFESGLRSGLQGPSNFLRPDQFKRINPAALDGPTDGSDGGVIVPDLDFAPSFYNGFIPSLQARFPSRPTPIAG